MTPRPLLLFSSIVKEWMSNVSHFVLCLLSTLLSSFFSFFFCCQAVDEWRFTRLSMLALGVIVVLCSLLSSIIHFAYEIFKHCNKRGTVEIRYNGLEGTGEFWLLNPNVVKLKYQLLISNRQTCIFNELQWLLVRHLCNWQIKTDLQI